jgi:hypothetical protein
MLVHQILQHVVPDQRNKVLHLFALGVVFLTEGVQNNRTVDVNVL